LGLGGGLKKERHHRGGDTGVFLSANKDATVGRATVTNLDFHYARHRLSLEGGELEVARWEKEATSRMESQAS